jgi:hypothetical protein
MEHIYIISSPSYQSTYYKIGRTTQTSDKLLKNYTRALGIPIIELFLDTNNSILVEKEIFLQLNSYRVYKRHEIFKGDLNYFKKICINTVDKYKKKKYVYNRKYCSRFIFVLFCLLISSAIGFTIHNPTTILQFICSIFNIVYSS